MLQSVSLEIQKNSKTRNSISIFVSKLNIGTNLIIIFTKHNIKKHRKTVMNYIMNNKQTVNNAHIILIDKILYVSIYILHNIMYNMYVVQKRPC